MDWWQALLIILGSFLVLLIMGVPVAFGFLLVNVITMIFLWSGASALEVLVLSIYDSIANFALVPLPMFILMGEVLFHSGIGPRMIETVDSWFGRMPGRLSLIAVAAGTVFSTLTGSSASSCAVLGSVLVPEMEKRGYKNPMSLGPIMGSAGLAIMIPPTALGILLAALAKISAGQLLIAIIVPGLMMAVLFAAYIIIRAYLQPSLAPPYQTEPVPLKEKVKAFSIYVLPLGFIIFLVMGVIFLGIATPTESAATGALGCIILAAAYKGLNRESIKKTMAGTIQVTGMVLMILMGAFAFAQILAFTGASRGLLQIILGWRVAPIVILICMQIILLIMGCFMEAVSIMMVTLPIYMPIVEALGFNPIWFGAMMLLNIEMGEITPPFGFVLYVMKGVAPRGTSMGDVYLAAMPFVFLDLVVMALMIVFPATTLWLPSIMR